MPTHRKTGITGGATVKKSSSGTPSGGTGGTKTHATVARLTPTVATTRITSFDQAQQRIRQLCANNHVPYHAVRWLVGTAEATGMNGSAIDQYVGQLWLLNGLVLVAES